MGAVLIVVNRAVVLAYNPRKYPNLLADNRPGAMLPALGKPLVARIMERLHRAGIQKFTVVISEDEGAVAAYLNQHWLPDVTLDFIIQYPHTPLTETLIGLGQHSSEPFVLTTYDSFVHTNFPERLFRHFEEDQSALVLSGAPISLSRSPLGVYATVEGQKVKALLSQKPAAEWLLLTPLAVCGSEFIDYLSSLEKGAIAFNRQLLDIFSDYVGKGEQASVVEGAWILQVETDDDLLAVNKLLLDEGQDAHILSDVPSSVQIIPPVRIDPHVSIGSGAKIGPHVYLESGCSIGYRATVQNALVLQKAVVPADSVVSDLVLASGGKTRKRE